MNYFELFQIPVSLTVDTAELSVRYRDLQRQFHPDNVAAQSDAIKLASMQKTVEINNAYNTLKNPLACAEYLLMLQGIDLRSEQHTVKDTAFLMEQLEWREELDDLQNKPDESAISQFQSRVKQHYQRYFQSLERQLADAQFNEAADTLRKLKFIQKMKDELDKLEESLFDL
ncbi:co-chaperone HscB [Tolumonas lignilytica]|uniref:co-chaperone HscB n=1 Tax=Tolumonas lignilytica TaxID=1283284 RepID=UPI0004672501|nr:co-chaperone HscB [Tolumonas lignilytica]